MGIIDLNIVKEQYQRMADEELVRFAKNESLNLTLESFHLLRSEFRSRNLDFTVIETAQVDRELAEATKISEFERTTAASYTETIWKFAFNEKELGRSDGEIFNALLKKNIAPEYAAMLIASIEPRSRELARGFENEITVGWILFILGIFLTVFLISSLSASSVVIIWGPLLTIGGLVRLATSYSRRKRYQTIVQNIEAESEIESKLYQ